MARYKIGEEITATYQNPPVAKKLQYPIGKLVTVTDEDTDKILAKFIVEKSNNYKVIGYINWVKT